MLTIRRNRRAAGVIPTSTSTASAAERAREQKLSRLAETAQTISDQIGSGPAEVVAYLLCGETSGLPYVNVTRSPQYGGYVITVRDRRSSVGSVATVASRGWHCRWCSGCSRATRAGRAAGSARRPSTPPKPPAAAGRSGSRSTRSTRATTGHFPRTGWVGRTRTGPIERLRPRTA